MHDKFILLFHEVGTEDINLVGGKGANLGEMTKLGIPVPQGFIITVNAYFSFLEEAELKHFIQDKLINLDVNDTNALNKASEDIKSKILSSQMPQDIIDDIKDAYIQLSNGLNMLVAVRSSATAEDLQNASFAGQQSSFLNVTGDEQVVENVKKCWASLFEARAIFYRQQQNIDHFTIGIAVPVQKMIVSEVSGIMFSIDPVENNPDKIIIEAVYGLGEYIALGMLTPDHYEIDKTDFTILKKRIVNQTHKLIRAFQEESSGNMDVTIDPIVASQQKLSDQLIIQLAHIAKKLEDYFNNPQDIEWAVENNTVYLVQTRPVTTHISTKIIQGLLISKTDEEVLKTEPIFSGVPASPGIACGQVILIKSQEDYKNISEGNIVVTDMTQPEYITQIKKAAAIITDFGGRTCDAAIVSREVGIPCIVGAENATKILQLNQVVTVNGSTGKIYNGGIAHKLLHDNEFDQYAQLKTKTKIFVNCADPKNAEDISKLAVDGVGLLRSEFMIAQMGVHPKKFIDEGKQEVFVEMLYKGISQIAHAFNPRPVLYRASDFKSNEYALLLEGAKYESEEANPMLGNRGCLRYLKNPNIFNLELEAIKRVYLKDGLKNVHLEIPFVRTCDEMKKVRALVDASGISSLAGFELWMMVEIPSNVLLLSSFIEVGFLQGISIGSNDLTMLILGLDRDNSEVASEFDERDEAVMMAFEKIIKTANECKIKSSICGQAPSIYPEITKSLVEWGIGSISVSPDMIYKTRKIVSDVESALEN